MASALHSPRLGARLLTITVLSLAACAVLVEAQAPEGFETSAGLNHERPGGALANPPGHSACLVGLGLLLSLAALLAVAVLGVVTLAAVGGAPVPLLAALPTSSAALLTVQLLARVAQEANASSSLVDLGGSLAWAAPPEPDWELVLVAILLLSVYAGRRFMAELLKGSGGTQLPHGFKPGAWEMRALGLVAFPLSAASAGILLGRTQRPVLGSVTALLVIISLVHQILLSLKVVTEALEEGRVVRVELPPTTGGEVFVDRICDQLLALPMVPQTLGCSLLYGGWTGAPGWCVAPAVAAVREVEQRGQRAHDPEMEGWPAGNPWCSGDDPSQANGTIVEFEDELQGRPLLDSDGLEHEEVEGDEGGGAGEESPGPRPPGGAAAEARGAVEGEPAGSPPRPVIESFATPSAVHLAHPLRVTTVAAYEMKSRDFVAGVACIPWLDCAVPAGVLPRIEELGGDTEIRVHPGQLSGPLTGGRFAACFDWGTRWPLRWTVEVALKVALGVWAAAPLRGGPAPGLLSGLGHLLMLILAGSFTYGVLSAGPYEHRNDDAALVAASLSSVLVVLLRALGQGTPGLAFALAVAAGGLALAPCALALLAAVGLASTTLSQLEAQGLQDRCLPRTVPGWGRPGRNSTNARSSRPGTTGASGSAGGGRDEVLPWEDGHAIEVVLPGQRKAFSIVLPAVARPHVVHAQLLPPVANRNGDPECLPPCLVTGDRARLPVPAALLFPGTAQAANSGTGLAGEVDMAELDRRRSVPPLLALLAPGHAGRAVYAEPEHNEGGAEWRQAIESFFGFEGGLLAEEAERLVEEHALVDGAATRSALVVVEVLPAWAGEFLDDRRGPPEGA